MPDAATIAGWQRYAGQAQMGDSTVVYELYVNPVRPALYEITRYRVTSTDIDADGRRAQPRGDGEGRSGTRPSRASRSAASSGSRRGAGRSSGWARRGSGGGSSRPRAAYKSEMRTAIQVYNLHNQQQVD